MAFLHGKTAGVFVNEFDLSSDFTQYNFSRNVQTVNVTTFGNGSKVYLPGLVDASLSVQGIVDTAADRADEEFNALLGTETVFTVSPTGFAAIGDRAHLVNGFIDNYQPRSPGNDAVRFSSGITSSAVAGSGVTLHHNNQESAPANFASVDGGAGNAPSTQGATAHLHVTEFTGTNATVTVEDSANDSVFGSLVAFTAATGVTSEKVAVTGNVERYVRINLAGTFTTITFVVGFHRGLI